MQVPSNDYREIIDMLKADCDLNGVKLTVRWNKPSCGAGWSVRISPSGTSVYREPGSPIQYFKMDHLAILRRHAAEIRLTAVCGSSIRQLGPLDQFFSMSEVYYFPEKTYMEELRG